MRENLKNKQNIRSTFTGIFVMEGSSKGLKDYRNNKTTMLFRDIRDIEGHFITDHVWFIQIKEFKKLKKLKPGDTVQFDAKVTPYIKGYRGNLENIIERKPIEFDYTLTYPSRVKKLLKTARKVVDEEDERKEFISQYNNNRIELR